MRGPLHTRLFVASCLLFTVFLVPSILPAQEYELYFTSKKNHNYSKVETLKSFVPGDTIYGLLYVNTKSGYTHTYRLTDFAIDDNGEAVVPIRVQINGYEVPIIKWNVPLATGLAPQKKKSGLSKLIKEVTSSEEGPNGFYFQVLPASAPQPGSEWVKWFGIISGISKPQVMVTVGSSYENVKSEFTLDLSNGAGVFANWGAPYLDGQKRKKDSILMGQRKTKYDDSLKRVARLNEWLAEADKTPMPIAKVKKPSLEAEVLVYAKVNFEGTFLKAWIYSEEGYKTDHDYIVKIGYRMKNDSSGVCCLQPAKIRTENPTNEKEYIKEFTWYDLQSVEYIRCSKITASK